jgi:hypothetical protein
LVGPELSTIAPAGFLAERLGATLVADLTRRQAVVADGASHLKRPTAKLARLWADAVAIQRAAAAIAVRPGADDKLRLTTAAGHCGEAADEIQRAYPDVSRIVGVPALVDDFARLSTVETTERVLAAIAAVVHDFDVDNPGLLPTDMLAAGSAATWLGLAHYAMSGRLP